MDQREFVDEVQRQAGLSSRAETERAVWTTINLLCGQVPSQLLSPLAQLVPEGLGDAVRSVSAAADGWPTASEDAGSWCAEETPGRIEHAEHEDRGPGS